MSVSVQDIRDRLAKVQSGAKDSSRSVSIAELRENLSQKMLSSDNESYTGSGYIEPARTMVTGMAGSVAGGLAGGFQALNPFADEGASLKALNAVQSAMTVLPKSKEGKENLKSLGDFIESGMQSFNDNAGIFAGGVNILTGGDTDSATNIKERVAERGIPKTLADTTFDATNSPGLATLAGTTPDILMTALGLTSLRSIRTGTRLIDDAGRPTKALDKALDKNGLVFDNLTEQARLSIPDFASPKLLPSPKAEMLDAAENTVKDQIRSGGRDDALATLKLDNDNLKIDKLGVEAVRQGFKPGFVQAVKSANRQTKTAMREMLNISKRIKSNSRMALDVRPTDIVGNAVVKRIKFVRGKADEARIELNRIADQELRGQPIDSRPVKAKFRESLDDLDIRLTDGPSGVPRPVYEGSMISKDKTSQNVINDAIDLLSEGGMPDALRFHKLKRQLDNMIDFRKKSKDGLTDAGRRVLKGLRSALNSSLRVANPKYAEVNDTLSLSLGSFERLQKAVGPSIDIFGDAARASLGQDMRGLVSNRKTRVNLDSAVNQMDATSASLGGNFKEDIKDLALFANNFDNRFGAVAETGFKAEISSAVELAERASTQGATAAAADATVGAIRSKVQKMSGINDTNAFKVIDDLLKSR